jgi:hypothetical protein
VQCHTLRTFEEKIIFIAVGEYFYLYWLARLARFRFESIFFESLKRPIFILIYWLGENAGKTIYSTTIETTIHKRSLRVHDGVRPLLRRPFT